MIYRLEDTSYRKCVTMHIPFGDPTPSAPAGWVAVEAHGLSLSGRYLKGLSIVFVITRVARRVATLGGRMEYLQDSLNVSPGARACHRRHLGITIYRAKVQATQTASGTRPATLVS
jgi:hypothetical protein